MPKYHILYEAEIEPSFEVNSRLVDDLFNAFEGEVYCPGGELIVTPLHLEPEQKLPTIPGAIIKPRDVPHHPGWVLNAKGEWLSLLLGKGYAVPVDGLLYGLREGKAYVFFDGRNLYNQPK